MATSFGELVRVARKAKDLHLDDLGELIGRDQPRMSRIEHGKCRPTAREVADLVRVLGLPPDEALRLAAEVDPHASRAIDDAPNDDDAPAPAADPTQAA